MPRISIPGQEKHYLLHPHSNCPGRSILYIGSSNEYKKREDALWLPQEKDVQDQHALIFETKAAHFYVFVNLAPDASFINKRRSGRVKILHHLDRIELGKQQKVSLLYRSLFVEYHPKSACKICQELRNNFFICPGCGKQYCTNCVLEENLICGCGFSFRREVTKALQVTPLVQYYPNATVDYLNIQFVTKTSEYYDKHCSFDVSSGEAPHDINQFKEKDEIVLCMECGTPYHLNCWFSLDKCSNVNCSANDWKKFRAGIFEDTE